jgi:hypothetical protein
MKKFLALAALIVPSAASAQVVLFDIFQAFTTAFGNLIVVAVAIALAVFIWGVVTFMMKSDDEQAIIAGKKRMFWGLIALFVVVTIWGIVILLMSIFGVEDRPDCDPTQIDLGGAIIWECDY